MPAVVPIPASGWTGQVDAGLNRVATGAFELEQGFAGHGIGLASGGGGRGSAAAGTQAYHGQSQNQQQGNYRGAPCAYPPEWIVDLCLVTAPAFYHTVMVSASPSAPVTDRPAP